MKAIIRLEVPEFQIGKEVSCYFKDTMSVNGTCEKAEPCEDAISRHAVMNCFKKWQPYMATRLWDFEQELSNLPSVTPAENTGHWIDEDGIWFKCSECGAHRKMMPAYKEYYCPNCGAKMQEVKE